MNRVLNKILLIIVLIVGAYVGLAYLFPNFSFFKRKAVEIHSTKLIIEESKKIAQLFSAKYYSEIIVDSTKYIVEEKIDFQETIKSFSKTEYKDSSKTKILLIASGNCYAGNDLDNIKIKSELEGRSCHLIIPKARIYNTVVNPSDFNLFYEEDDWSKDEVQILKQRALEKVKSFALENGIIEKANNRTSQLLTDFLILSGYKDVKIEFEDLDSIPK